MLADIGYLVEKEYVDDVMAKFGEFDTDGNGLIDLAEFPECASHPANECCAPRLTVVHGHLQAVAREVEEEVGVELVPAMRTVVYVHCRPRHVVK